MALPDLSVTPDMTPGSQFMQQITSPNSAGEDVWFAAFLQSDAPAALKTKVKSIHKKNPAAAKKIVQDSPFSQALNLDPANAPNWQNGLKPPGDPSSSTATPSIGPTGAGPQGTPLMSAKNPVQMGPPSSAAQPPVPTPTGPSAAQLSGAATAGLGFVSDAASGIHDIASNAAQNQYADEIKSWEDSGKYWMNPDADLRPDIQHMMTNMPSQYDAFQKSGGIAADVGDSALKGASTGASIGSIVPGVGTAIGAGVGTVVGGALGAVEGLFTAHAAKDADQAKRQKALEQYMESVRQWTENRRKSAMAAGEAGGTAALANKADTDSQVAKGNITRQAAFQSMIQGIKQPQNNAGGGQIQPIVQPSLVR